jgi:DNA modification methylase
MEIEIYNKTGGYNPFELDWDDTITFPSTRNLLEYGNRLYNRYPARSIFLVPRAIINSKLEKKNKLNILDPFMGSGTTAVEASLTNSIIYGTEMDPFARLIAEVSLFRFSKTEENELYKILNDISLGWHDYPINNMFYPKLNNVEYWFDTEIFDDLLRLKSIIYETIENEKFLKFFKVTFADCIKPSSKLERQSTKPYISSKYPKKTKPVFESFKYSFNAHLNALKQYNFTKPNNKECKINWLGFDATDFKSEKAIIDLAITSPPYLNAFDYTQIIKIESAWVGTLENDDIVKLRNVQVGNEKRRDNKIDSFVENLFEPYFNAIIEQGKIDNKNFNITAKTCLSYFNDIKRNLECIKAVLKKGGEYHMIIGDNVIKKIEIPTHKLIAEIAIEIGFNWFGYYKYVIKDHRTSIPRKDKGGKINYEYVLMLKK